ncbi:MAG: hypothetical protein LBU78_06505 [Microbacterium sp.]|jgi:hypothetical protein|nr:hypothetical protein [Microbacterium sp.]
MSALRKHTTTIAIIGVCAVAAYAAWAAVQILVLNPLAAVPDAGLSDIYAQMSAAGEAMPVAMPLSILATGVGLAAIVAVVSISRRLEPALVAVLFLILLTLGTPAYFMASFGPGMNLADTFMISGGDHSPGVVPLYVVSLLSAGAAVGLAVRASRRKPVAAAA